MSRIHSKKGRFALFCVAMMLGALLLAGCSGSKGSAGAAGAAGATGATGPAGPAGPPVAVTATDESCSVCHSTGKTVDIAVAHPDPTGKGVTVSDITLLNNGGLPRVTFHVATDAGPVTDLVFSNLRFYMADMVPAGTATQWGTWDSPYFERWAYESSAASTPKGTLTNTGGGNYSYAFVTGFGSAAALAEAPNYAPTHTQRLFIRVSGKADAAGNALTNNTTGFLDFVVPAVGANAVKLDSQRMFVTTDACKKCHGPLFEGAAHADGYLDTRACVICHSPLGHYGTIMQNDSAYLSVFIHKIHAAIDVPAWEDRIGGKGFGAVTFPQDVKNCVICHTNSGMNLGSGDLTENWRNHPTAEICGSCHIRVNFATGENHGGGVQTNNTFCVACHPATGSGFGKGITAAHDITPTGVNVPEFDVAIGINPPANGTYYVAGETPSVGVTLKNHATGLAVAPAIYTTAKDTAGVTGGGLSVASLYVYGPRAKAVPVLATGTITDPAFNAVTGTPTQAHNLFVGGSDPRVHSNSNGFVYQLLPIPAGMEPGTYMVRARIGDYGRVGTGNYHIDSVAYMTIQIGTATVSKKVAGDACINCHGTGTAAFHDERHAVVFNTDECLSCHDQSGNTAIPIANRVHAIHSANSDGDIFNIQGGSRDWSDVTYPQDIATCVTCHASGNTTYKTLPFMMPCAGCHVGAVGAIDHMRQNGGPF